MASTADFKNGLCILFNNDLYTIDYFQHVKPGKGPAFVRTKLRNVKTGKIIDNTFNAGVKVDVQRIERRSYQFVYKEGEDYIFMNNETFEQIPLAEALINNTKLLKEGQNVEVVFHADTETALYAELPAHIIMEIIEAGEGAKGDTASGNALKPAVVETGATIMVPSFVNQGEKIKIDTRDNTYIERVK